jgi:ubiquitin carboxyl-terminal hydrolase L5
MNVPQLDLGDNLKTFKEETQMLKPPYRGQRLGLNDFVRSNHNSFARRMDILNSDLALSNDVDKWNKTRRNPKKRVATGKTRIKADDDENGFHFVAYVPVDDEVWRLDGLQRQPVCIGQYKGNWTSMARDNVSKRMAQYVDVDGVQFNLLSLCRSPLCIIPEQLVENIKFLISIDAVLDAGSVPWKDFVTDRGLELKPNECFGITQDLIENAAVLESELRRLDEAGTDMQKLLDLRQELIQTQNQLQFSFMDEVASIGHENEEAERRKHDYTPIIYNSIKTLAEEGLLQGIVQDVRTAEGA